MYCSNCNLLTEDSRCPVCNSQYLREPKYDDYCFLLEKELLWARALEDLFRDNGIPFVTREVLGAGLTSKIGLAMERKRFYVPYGFYRAAKELEEEFFSSEFVFEE